MNKKWTAYPAKKPKITGRYQCSVAMSDDINVVMDLLYDKQSDKWFNPERQKVFMEYEIYKKVEGPEGKPALQRVYTDELCNLTEKVRYFKVKPKPVPMLN